MLLKARRCRVVLLIVQGFCCFCRHRRCNPCYCLDFLCIPASRWFGNRVGRFGPSLPKMDTAFHQNTCNHVSGLDKNNAKDHSHSQRLAHFDWDSDFDSWLYPVAPNDHLPFPYRGLPCMAGQQHSHDHPDDIENLSTTPSPSAQVACYSNDHHVRYAVCLPRAHSIFCMAHKTFQVDVVHGQPSFLRLGFKIYERRCGLGARHYSYVMHTGCRIYLTPFKIFHLNFEFLQTVVPRSAQSLAEVDVRQDREAVQNVYWHISAVLATFGNFHFGCLCGSAISFRPIRVTSIRTDMANFQPPLGLLEDLPLAAACTISCL
jgi:hypothetical protein